ncbi:hypothetical protein IKF20_02760 [Candidatus Saccharibacteria bacterium]|nr:hypothetical protein [Candidatus Saccharibacteria bacterium]
MGNKILKTDGIIATTIVLSSLAVFSGFVLSSEIASADSSSSNAAITVPLACTMNGSGMNNHSAEISNGTYQSEIGTTTIKVVCNDPSGFSIYAVGYTGDSLTDTNHTKLVGATSNVTIATGTATTAGNPDVSNWAMKLAANSSDAYPVTLQNGYGSYSIVPDTYVKVASRTSNTDSGVNAIGSTITTSYAAYIAKNQIADTYNGKVKYTLVHPHNETPQQPQPSQSNIISYYPNANLTTGTMSGQWINVGDTPALIASNFARTGYGFAGWNDAYDYSGTFYGMNETVNVTSEMETNGLSLYAVWVESEGYLQDSSTVASVCNRLTAASASTANTLSSVSALTDRRDGNTYAIAKLADGKCWMIENLRLSNSTELTTSNTHNPLTINNIVSILNDDGTTTNHLSATSSNWCLEETSACVDQSKLNTDNTALYLSNTTGSKTGNVYSYGNYYNWYSATAGHGIRYTSASFTSPGDICPSGWRLPTGGSSNSEIITINNLANSGSTTTSAGLRTFPNNFAFAGMVSTNSGNISDRSWYGNYWTATDSYGGAYGLKIADGGGGASPTDLPWKYTGHSVRCIADLQYN